MIAGARYVVATVAAHLLLSLHLLLQPGLLSDGLLLSDSRSRSSCRLSFGLLLQLSDSATSESIQVTVVELPLHQCKNRFLSAVSDEQNQIGVCMCCNQSWLMVWMQRNLCAGQKLYLGCSHVLLLRQSRWLKHKQPCTGLYLQQSQVLLLPSQHLAALCSLRLGCVSGPLQIRHLQARHTSLDIPKGCRAAS